MAYSSFDALIAKIRKVIETDERKLATEKVVLAELEGLRASEQERIARSLANEPPTRTDEFINYKHVTTPIERKPNGAAAEDAGSLEIDLLFSEDDIEQMEEQFGTKRLTKEEREQFLSEYRDLWSAQMMNVGEALLEGMLEKRLGILGKDLPLEGS